MKLNISYPATGCQKLIEVDDEKKLRVFYEKRIATEVSADSLGDEWKGYIVRISGGNDKQGFPMKQGVLTTGRVRLLLSKGHSCYRPRRDGERRRKSVRGCIVDGNLSVLNLVIVKKGEAEIPNITDTTIPRRLGPKRASKIRKLFNLSKEDDVRRYVIKRPMPPKEGKKPKTKSPKIQRLVTPRVLAHKRRRIALKLLRRQKSKEAAAEYAKLLAMRAKEARQKRAELFKRRRYRTASLRESQSKQEGGTSDSLKEGGTKELTKKEFKRELLKKKLAASKKSMEKKRKGKKDMIDIRALKARSYSGAWRGINVERIGRGYLPIKGRSRFGIKLSKKAIAKKLSGKKELAKKKSIKKPSDGKHPGVKRPDSKKPEGKKPAGKRPEGKRPADKKAEGKRPESKKSEGKQSAGKRPEGKNLEGKRSEGKKPEVKKPEGKKPEVKKSEKKKTEVKKPEGKKTEVKKSESKQSDGKRPEVKRPESKKSDAKRPEGKHPAPASKEVAAKKAKKDVPKTSAKKTEKPKK